jgi:hypothetical protein
MIIEMQFQNKQSKLAYAPSHMSYGFVCVPTAAKHIDVFQVRVVRVSKQDPASSTPIPDYN